MPILWHSERNERSVQTHASAVEDYVFKPCFTQLLKLEVTKEAKNSNSYGYLITFIHKYKKEIKSRHDGSWQIYILFQWLRSVIVSTDWVCCCQNRCPCIQSSLTTKKKNFDRLKKMSGMVKKHMTKCLISFIIN